MLLTDINTQQGEGDKHREEKRNGKKFSSDQLSFIFKQMSFSV